MSRDDEILSAYLDGEVPEPFASRVREMIEQREEVRNTYNRFATLSQRLSSEPEPDFSASHARVWSRVNSRVGTSHGPSVWTRRVGVPVPLIAAAALLVVALTGLTMWSALRPQDAGTYLSQAQGVDVTISVNDTQMELIMEWLSKENMLGDVNIQLPADREYRMLGDPVLLRMPPGQEPVGGVAQ